MVAAEEEESAQEQEQERRGRGLGQGGRSAAMRVIVPLQAVFQGPGGLVLGTILPCALFYALQLLRGKWRTTPPPGAANRSLVQNPSQTLTLTAPSAPANDVGVSASNQKMDGVRISARGLKTLSIADSEYYRGWEVYERNPYDPMKNPGGCIQLGLAENQVSWDLIESWLKNHPLEWPDDGSSSFHEVAGYKPLRGMDAFKNVLASFMREITGGRVNFKKEQMVLTSGTGAAVELLAFILADPGDGFLVPSPYYPGFDTDIKSRSGVNLVPVPCHSDADFKVTKEALDRTFNEAEKASMKIRAILISSPTNPVGNTLDMTCLSTLLNFATEKKLHIISDEVYAGCVFANPAFISIAELVSSQGYDAARVHIICGLSKNLGVPGFRVGVLYTWNTEVSSAALVMNRFCAISSPTQCLLTAMLSDKQFVNDYISENIRRLGEKRKLVSNLLEKVGIHCAKSNSGLFVWMDMRQYLPSNDSEGELIFWRRLLYEGGLNVTPGTVCHCTEPGWFRLCFASVSDETLSLACERLKSLFI